MVYVTEVLVVIQFDRGVGTCSNSIQCTSCHKWVHKKCSGIVVGKHVQSDEFIYL